MTKPHTYAVTVATAAGPLTTHLNGEGPPRFWPSDDGVPVGFMQIGKSFFRVDGLLAVVAREDNA
jgi:hypothetical protein